MGVNYYIMLINTTKKNGTNKKVYLYAREFLNKPTIGSFASIIASIILRTDYRDDIIEDVYINSTLDLHDCDRKISFDIDLSNKESYDNTVYKVDKLISVLNDFRKNLDVAYKDYDNLRKERDKQYKKRMEKEKKLLGNVIPMDINNR